ncbi:MAG: hypothetical protein Q9172_004185 [Xanthocarpia lactea]
MTFLIHTQAGGISWINYQQVMRFGSDLDLLNLSIYFQVDRWLYGHPDHKKFDSPNRFFPHFKYLMQHGTGDACKCDLCTSKKRTASPRVSTTRPLAAPTNRQTRPPPFNRGFVDEEGTPDVFCSLFTLLKHEGKISRAIEERASLDWRAERSLVKTSAKVIPKQPAFIPRHGETVLYLHPLPPGIQLQQDPKTHQIYLHDTITDRSAGSPKWLAGVVTQVPSTKPETASLYPPPSTLSGGANNEIEEPSLNLSGFRIEPLPSLNSSDKYLSKQHTYTQLHLIRPFAFWQLLLEGIPQSEWHTSIHNAITASATVSLINREQFNGRWPNASIYSKGLFVGAECYWIGDTVRLLFDKPSAAAAAAASQEATAPYKNNNPVIVMEIQQIISKFHNLHPEPSNNAIVTGNRCDRISLTLQGPIYTSTRETSTSHLPVPQNDLSPPMQTYNDTSWWHLTHPLEIHSVSFSNIHSRLYESDAVASYFPSLPQSVLLDPHVSNGEAVTRARAIAAATDERTVDLSAEDYDDDEGAEEKQKKKKKEWFWADCRAEGLDLQSVNGLEVGLYDGEREPKLWRQVLGVVDGWKERVDRGVVVGNRREEAGEDSESGSGSGSEVEREEERRDDVEEDKEDEEDSDDDDDDVMEIEAPEKKKARVEVTIPLRK